MSVTIPGWVLLLLPAAPILAGDALMAAAAMLTSLLLLLIDFAFSPHARGITVARAVEKRLSIGVPATVTLRFESPGKASHLQVRDAFPDGLPPDVPLRSVTIPARGAVEAGYVVTPTRRGTYLFEGIHLRTTGLFKLIQRRTFLPLRTEIHVTPNLREIRRYQVLSRRASLSEMGVHRVRYLGSGIELDRLRDYAPDDDTRRIDWKATARRRKPITREFDAERSQNVLFLVDCGRRMGAEAKGLLKLDHALNSLVLSAFVGCGGGDCIGFVTFSDRVLDRCRPRAGRRHFLDILDRVHRTPLEPVESDYAKAFLAAREILAKRSLVIVFTDLSDPLAAAPLRVHALRFAEHHLVVVVTLRDPALDALAGVPPGDLTSLFRRAAAEKALLEKEALKDDLGRAGIDVLEASADRLTPETLNRYLLIKARGVL